MMLRESVGAWVSKLLCLESNRRWCLEFRLLPSPGQSACQAASSVLGSSCVQETVKQTSTGGIRPSRPCRLEMGAGLLAPAPFQEHVHSQPPPIPSQKLVRQNSTPGSPQNFVAVLQRCCSSSSRSLRGVSEDYHRRVGQGRCCRETQPPERRSATRRAIERCSGTLGFRLLEGKAHSSPLPKSAPSRIEPGTFRPNSARRNGPIFFVGNRRS